MEGMRGKLKIAVIGPGSMGSLYGGKLSEVADVTLVGTHPEHVAIMNRDGIYIRREDQSQHFMVKAVTGGQYEGWADLVILFTKAYLTEAALEENRGLIGPDTYLLTLQNGAGHEAVLGKFVSPDRVLLGTTAQGASREDVNHIVHSGLGDTVLGCPAGVSPRVTEFQKIFEAAGFPCQISDHISFTIWNKLMINASSSVLSGVLGMHQGYVKSDSYAWEICQRLIREICLVAEAEGVHFEAEEQILRIQKHLQNASGGYTSVYADLKNGRRTEADFISGYVAARGKVHGIPTPTQDMMVLLVHAMEGRQN